MALVRSGYQHVAGCRFNSLNLKHCFYRCLAVGQSSNGRAESRSTGGGSIFASKKSSDIFRTIAVLKFCSYDFFIRNSMWFMSLGPKLLGKRLFESLLRGTIYSQFVAGETFPAIQGAIKDLKMNGIGTMLYVPVEEDLSSEMTEFRSREGTFDRNAENFLDCIEKVEAGGYVQMKVTAICSPVLLHLLDSHLAPYQTTAEKPEELSVQRFAQGLDESTKGTNLIPAINAAQNEHLLNSLRRLNALAEKAVSRNARIVVDAEQCYIQATMNQMVLALQYKFNKQKPWVYNTYQCYRKDTFDRLQADLELMDKAGFNFGAKIVRGAYMRHERQQAQEMGYDDPINDSYEDTNKMYDKVLGFVLEKVASTPSEVMVASHNEESIEKAIQRMNELGIQKESGQVAFAQLYGMCDHVSLSLGKEKYKVYKSVPYGPVDTTLLYLVRRASENKDVATRTAKERYLLRQELKRRAIPW